MLNHAFILNAFVSYEDLKVSGHPNVFCPPFYRPEGSSAVSGESKCLAPDPEMSHRASSPVPSATCFCSDLGCLWLRVLCVLIALLKCGFSFDLCRMMHPLPPWNVLWWNPVVFCRPVLSALGQWPSLLLSCSAVGGSRGSGLAPRPLLRHMSFSLKGKIRPHQSLVGLKWGDLSKTAGPY